MRSWLAIPVMNNFGEEVSVDIQVKGNMDWGAAIGILTYLNTFIEADSRPTPEMIERARELAAQHPEWSIPIERVTAVPTEDAP